MFLPFRTCKRSSVRRARAGARGTPAICAGPGLTILNHLFEVQLTNQQTNMARRVRVRGTRRQVWAGTRQKTTASGHSKADLMRSKSGKIVTKKSHAAGKRAFKNIRGWTQAVSKARKALGITGFCAVKKGTALYKKAREFYN